MIREYKDGDLDQIIDIFINTIMAIDNNIYGENEKRAWISGIDRNKWVKSLKENYTLVMEKDGKIIGFSDMDRNGYLDRLYILPDYQNKGFSNLLLDEMEKYGEKFDYITVDASIVAKPVFLKRGYELIRENKIIRDKEILINYTLRKYK